MSYIYNFPVHRFFKVLSFSLRANRISSWTGHSGNETRQLCFRRLFGPHDVRAVGTNEAGNGFPQKTWKNLKLVQRQYEKSYHWYFHFAPIFPVHGYTFFVRAVPPPLFCRTFRLEKLWQAFTSGARSLQGERCFRQQAESLQHGKEV